MTAILRPASLGWLVWHDVRVKARAGQGRWGRRIAIGVIAILPIAGGIAAAWAVRDAAMVPLPALGKLSAALAVMLLVMVSSGYAQVLRLGRDRGELELLMTAPVPVTRVVAARTAGVVAVVTLPFLLVSLPFFVASVLFGHDGWAAGPLVVAAIALIGTAIALLLVTGLEWLVGPARARTLAQVAGVVLASAVFALGQAPNVAPRWFAAQLAALETPPPAPLVWPARALFGDPLPLLAVLALALAAAMLAARVAAGRLEAAPPAPGGVERRGREARFGGSAMRVMFAKELTLLGRDPELISQIGQQLVFMVPVVALIFTDGQITPARMAAAGVFLGGALASSLAWLVICAEDAPDLIAAAPLRVGTVLRAKLAAALTPPMLLVLVLALVVAWRDAGAAALMLPMALLAGVASAAMQIWAQAPARRSAFRQRYRSSLLMAFGEFFLLGCLAAATRLMLAHSWWTLLALAGPALLLALVFEYRVKPAD